MKEPYISYYIIISSMFAFLGIAEVPFLILFILICMDSLLGLIESLIFSEKTFKSHILSSGLIRKMVLMLVPLTIGLVCQGLGVQKDIIYSGISGAIGFLVCAEGISVINHISNIYSGEISKNEIDSIKGFLGKIKEFIGKMIEFKK